jgi:UDP-GlcNAc3NAcA epimerase
MSMKVVTIIGARPQFIKAAPVSHAFQAAGWKEFILHTGQHYDAELSQVFFNELGLRPPRVNLEVGSGSHAQQTGQMLTGIEAVLQQEKPDWTVVYGDTNSTLAGALAAVKLHVPVAHVEAGLRSFNRLMPEEHNRILTDHCADLLLCPTQTAVLNLNREGLTNGVWVGDVMYDAALMFAELAERRSTILYDLALAPRGYYLATIHRAYNTDYPCRLEQLLDTLSNLDLPVIFPLHPRARTKINEFNLSMPLSPPAPSASPRTRANEINQLKMIPPVGYLDMLTLEQNARMILTDSGGVQKEAYFFAVPCLTLRPETEWVETVQAGWNRVVDADPEQIAWAAHQAAWPTTPPPPVFGDGHAAKSIVETMLYPPKSQSKS